MKKTMQTLRKEAKMLGITNTSKMSKEVLVIAIAEKNTKETQTDGDALCGDCLQEQFKQRLIDENESNKKKYKPLIAALRQKELQKCQCEFIPFNDVIVCKYCYNTQRAIDWGKIWLQ